MKRRSQNAELRIQNKQLKSPHSPSLRALRVLRGEALLMNLSSLILLAVVVLAQVPPPPPPPSNAGAPAATTGKRGAITGRVLGEDGQPLEGAAVMALAMNGGRLTNRMAVSDDEGNFSLKDLPAAAYTIQAILPGLVNSQGALSMESPFANSGQRYRTGESVTITMVKGGAITGKVYDGVGQPLVGASVWVLRVRDAEGRSVNEMMAGTRPGMSDDRGVYRIYGLQAGSYIVYTGGAGQMFTPMMGSGEVPTYFPNATRDTAQEVSVSPGMDVQGIDIRHRGDSGHAISGKLIGGADANTPGTIVSSVEVYSAATGTRLGSSTLARGADNGFAIFGIPDGDYEIIATQRVVTSEMQPSTDGMTSVPRRISVRSNDVTGIELRLVSLSSIAGRVVVEPFAVSDPKACQITRRGDLTELMFVPRREDKEIRRTMFTGGTPDAIPNDKGEFVVRDLEAGRYRLMPQLPSDHWYLKAMNLGNVAPAKPAASKPAAKTTVPNIAASGITLKGGEKLSGLTVTIAEGAAGLSGRVDGQKLPRRLRVYLVPSEPEAASDVLRYYEVTTRDGSFALNHLSPGKYWLIARAVPDDESDEKPAKPAAWDANERVKLRREAEAEKNEIALTNCQRVKEFILKFGAAVK